MYPTDPLPISPIVQSLFKRMARLSARRRENAYAVGGFVRDLILGRPSSDVDVAVEGDGLSYARDFARLVKGRCEAFTRFGTSIVVVPGFGKIDIATTRAETYARPGVLPDVRPAPLADDLKRRDFTVNSIALRLKVDGKSEWIDPANGAADLASGVLRAHHPRSFEDDPTRIFRAVRFEQRFGFVIDGPTQEWLADAVKRGLIERVSGERLRNELRLIFAEPQPEKAVRRLDEWGVWKHLHPRLNIEKVPDGIPDAVKTFGKSGVEEPWMIWFACLSSGLDEPQRAQLGARLMLSGDEKKILMQCGAPKEAARAALEAGQAPLSRVHPALSPLRPEVWAWLWAESDANERQKVEVYVREAGSRKPILKGTDLSSMGWKPGPVFAKILTEAEGLQLDGVLADRPAALAWLQEKRRAKPPR